MQLIVWNVLYAILDQFASGQLAMTEIVPILERTLYRMTRTVAAPSTVATDLAERRYCPT